MQMTRAEHLAWCKKRAHEYVAEGDCTNAVASMISDINKHPETEMKGPMAAVLMAAAMNEAGDPVAIRHWIDGFN